METTPRQLANALAAQFSALREREDSILAQLAVYKELLDLSPCPTVLTDKDGMVVYVNKSYCDLLGVTLEQVAVHGWIIVIDPLERESVIAKWKEVVASGVEDFSAWATFLTVSGPSWMLWRAKKLPTSGYAAVIFHPGCAFHKDCPMMAKNGV